MDIYLSTELLTALGTAAGALILAVLWMLVRFVRHLSSFATALDRGMQVNSALNDELLSVIKERKEANELWAKERNEWNLKHVKLQSDITTMHASHNEAMERLDRQLNGTISQIAQIRQQRDRLQGEFDAMKRRVNDLETENKDLHAKITALETKNQTLVGERMVLIEKLDNLTRRLEAEIANNNDLRCELDKLQSRMQNIPSTDDVSKAAAKVTADVQDPPLLNAA